MADTNEAVNNGVEKVIKDFIEHPRYYFTEEDVRWRLMKEIESALITQRAQHVRFSGNNITSAVHAEYPTPFRCSLGQSPFELLDEDSSGRRGHFDIVVLNASAVAQYDFEVLRSQNYDVVREKLLQKGMPIPFLDAVIEIKLFRDLAHPKRTDSARQQAKYAIQAIDKVAAVLRATQYYPKPFANRGLVLLFDNSDLVCTGDVGAARNRFLEELNEYTARSSLPNTLSCILVTQQGGKIIIPFTKLENKE